MGSFVLLDFSILLLLCAISCSPSFPLFLSLLHFSFLTHSRGVRFLQLVHISAPISRTPLPPALASLLPSFAPSPPPLPHADLWLSWPAMEASMSREGVSSFSLTHIMSPTYFIPNPFILSSPTLSFSSHPQFPFSFVLIVSSYLSTFLSSTTTPPPPPAPPPVTSLVSATLNNFIMLSPPRGNREKEGEHKPAHISIPGSVRGLARA